MNGPNYKKAMEFHFEIPHPYSFIPVKVLLIFGEQPAVLKCSDLILELLYKISNWRCFY